MSSFGIIFFISIATNICSKSGGNTFDYIFDGEINRQKCNGWGQMKCWSGQCANITGKCNGVKDCVDGSDETDYFCRGNSCEEDQFQCGYGACVPMKAKCNGTQECWDGTDELKTLCSNEMYTTLPSTILDPIISVTKSNKSRKQVNAVLFEDIDHYHTNNQSKATKSTLSIPNVETQTPIFENNLSIDNSFVYNSSAQIHTNSQPQTEVVPHNVKNPEKLTTIKELEITKSKIEGSTRPLTIGTITLDTTLLPPTKMTSKYPQLALNGYNITKTTTILPPVKVTTKYPQMASNRYNSTKTTHPTATTKTLNECVLGSCSHPLLCNTSVPGSHDSEIAYDTQGRLYFIEGSQVTFNCAAGYNLEGESRLTCTPSGWNHKNPSCIPYCNSSFIHNCTLPLRCFFEQPNTRSKVSIRKSFAESRVREHTEISFACDEGYQLEGPNIRKCTVKGWSNEMPRCVNHCDISDLGTCKSPLKCKVFDSSTQRLVDYRYSLWVSKMKENSYFEYSCEDGYKMTGESRSSCMNNGWSSNSPTCIPLCDLNLITSCKAPLTCNFKKTRSSFSNVVKPYSDVHVEYACKSGFELVGAKIITCTNDGWSDTVPTCKEITCDTSLLDDCTYPLNCMIYDRARQNYKGLNREDIQQLSNNENLYVSCEDGFILQGPRYLECSRGKWVQNMPKCIAAGSCRGDLMPTCKYPLSCTIYDSQSKSEQIITDNSKYKSTNYALNSQIIFGCANGYKLEGEKKTICGLNGWSHEQSLKLPQCSPLCDPGIFKSCKEPLSCYYYHWEYKRWMTVMITKIPENFHVYFNCNSGLRLYGPTRIECKSKGWDNPLPKCV